jgi:glucosylceramidase
MMGFFVSLGVGFHAMCKGMTTKTNESQSMMKLIMILILTALTFAVHAELLTNGDFEQGATGQLGVVAIPGWNSWGNSGWHNDDAGAVIDTKSMKFWWDGVGMWQDFAATAGTIYAYSVQVMDASRDTSANNWDLQIEAEFYNAANTQLTAAVLGYFDSTIQPNDTWVEIGSSITAPAGTAYGRIILRQVDWHSGIAGGIYFDNASVVPAGFVQKNPNYNGDPWVDLDDLALLAGVWLQSNSVYDLNGDGFINSGDFVIFAKRWLEYQDPPYESLDLTINAAVSYQEIDGFGASLTDSSAWLIYVFLNPSERQAVLTNLFDPDEGIGLSYLRQPMGASDLRLAEYTYDDRPAGQTDYNLNYFNVAYEQQYIIPALQEILAINPNVKIMGSPWSPPAWMKTSGQIGGGSLKSDVYNTYANYFVKYIQAYAAHGIPVDAVTLQNEPYLEPGTYGGCHMEPTDQIKLVKLMGPAFAANSITTKIIVWDHNWDNTSFAISVLNDPVARPYIDGSAWHHYSGDVSAQTTVHDAYPDKNTYFTEGSDGTWNDGGFDADLIRNGTFVIDTIRNWAKTVVKWNLALDQNNGPKIAGGCDTCYGVVTINRITRQITPKPHYYALGHASKFLRPGAVRVQSNDSIGGLRTVAFKNTDGSIVSYVVNPDTDAHNLKIVWNGQWVIYTIPARSIVTFVWNDVVNAQVQVWVTTGDQTRLFEEARPVKLHN